MRFRLKFLNSQEQLVREFDIEADDDDSAIRYTCEQSVGLNMIAALSRDQETVIRVTPMTARRFLLDNRNPP